MSVPYPIAEGAAAILRQEVADGALANIASSDRMRAQTPELMSAATRARADLEDLAAAVLDLLAPRSKARRTSASWPEALHVLQPPVPGVPGRLTEIRARLRNDRPGPTDLSLACTALLTGSGESVPSDCIALRPERLRLGPGEEGDVSIRLAVPATAQRGLHRGLLQSSNCNGLCAVVRLPVA
jgi:hypothetical protein